MYKNLCASLLWVCGLACSSAFAAPIAFNGSYNQQFDTLATSGSANAWTNGETIQGWYLFKSDLSAVSTYRADSGTANNGAFYSYGSSGATERALGGVGSGSFEGFMALAATNATTATINTLNLRFDGEQWRNGGNTSIHAMKLEYGIGDSFANVTTWTAAGASFNWSSVVNEATAAAVDGNGAGRVADVGGTLSNLGWTPGATLWLRWVETNDAGSDHGLAIDNVRLSTGGSTPGVFTPPAGTTSGSSDASTAIALDADWMVVGDDEANVLRVYPRAGGAAVKEWSFGTQLGIGTSELDLEASTRIGNRLYFTGSHSNKKDGSEANNREHLFAVDVSGTGAATTFTYVAEYGGLEQALAVWDTSNAHSKGANYFGLAASSAGGVVPEASNGFSIEGLAATGSGQLLLGFRAPQANAAQRTKALLIPLTNPAAVLTGANPIFGAPIELDLGGRGVRSIERADDGKFLIVAGPAGAATFTASSSNFVLYVWDGASTTAQRLDNALDPLLASTGGSFETLVSPASTAAGTRVQLLQDNGDTVWPGRTKPSKDLQPADQQFVGNWITLGNPVATDTTPPVLQSSTPAAGATGVDPTASIQLVFSEAVRNGGGSFELRSGGTLISTLPAGDASVASFSGSTLTLRPPAGLSPNTAYTLAAVGSPVVDQAGNAWTGTSLGFTTGALAPVTRTVLISEVNSNATVGGDFFEIYNHGNTTVNLANWRWTDNSEDFSNGKVLPAGTTLAPGKALVIATESDAPAFCAAWGLATCDGVIRVSGKGLGKGDAVLLYDPSGQLVAALNYGTTAVYGANPATSGTGHPPVAGSHAGPAFAPAGSSVNDGVSAVWDGQSTSAPRYVPAAVGQLGGFAQPGAAVNIGSPGVPGGTSPSAGITLISAIQGPGEASPKVGESVTVRAVVTAYRPGLSGFFLQEEAADSDGNDATSEGIFVFYGGTNPGVTDATVGQLVELKAVVGEFRNQTQLTNVTGFEVKGPAALPNPVVLTLPVADMAVLERYEGMRVEVRPASGQLVVTDTQTLGRYGTVTLSVGQPQVQFTETNAPSTSGFEAFVKATQRGQIILDDGISAQNPPTAYGRNGQPLSASNTLRAGDAVNSVVGVLDQFVDSAAAVHETSYRVQPTVAPNFSGPERPTAADFKAAVGAAGLKIASANVLNYFNVIGATSGPSQVMFTTPLGNQQGIRGANNAQELERQRAKIVANLIGLDADIYGLMEVQNNGSGPSGALKDLTDALNASSDKPAGARYDYVKAPFKEGAAEVAGAGTDAITVAIIYRADRVQPAGTAAVASPVTYPAFSATGGSRVPVAQTFAVPLGSGATDQITVVVNHFKSKGSVLASPGNTDQGDGQGANNAARVMAANQLKSWLDTNPTGATSSNLVLVGDFNAYGKEQPITTLEGYGFIKVSQGDSYSFDGLWGSLDHIFVSAGLQARVGKVVKWAINAQEPVALDYNTEFNKPASYYAATPYRSSDHNPIVLGLLLGNQPPAILGVPATPRTVVAGEAFGLDGLTVSDPEGGTLTLSITASNARLLGLADADTAQPGLQLVGTPTQINALLAQAVVIADVQGATLTFTLTDGATAPVVAKMAFNVTPPGTVDPANQFNLGIPGQQAVTGTVTGGGATCRVVPSPQVVTPGAAGAQGLPRPNASLPFGMFALKTQNCDKGAMVTVKLSFPGALPTDAEYWKWGKSADNTSAHWYPLPASIQGNTVTFALRDGGLGDDDLRADGNIVDPGALVVAAAVGPTPVPTLGQWALLLLMVCLTGLARGKFAGGARRR